MFLLLAVLPVVTLAQRTGGPPVINREPQSQIVAAGTEVTFRVSIAQSYTPVRYQWQKSGYDLAGATNSTLGISNAALDSTLVITNVALRDAGDYAVVVANAAGAIPSETATLTVVQVSADPPSVSLGASVTLRVGAAGSAIGGYQWKFGGVNIPGATKSTLVLTNVHLADAGSYSVFVTNAVGSATATATLTIDPTFTKITTGSIVNDIGESGAPAWADFDNDGYLDLVVANGGGQDDQNEFLYRNNGDGTFTKIKAGPVVSSGGASDSLAVADYDNDGYTDLFVANFPGSGAPEANFLFRNLGGTNFQQITTGALVNDRGHYGGVGWADYDNDGFLDLFVPNYGKSLLFRNNGDGTFTKITTGPLANLAYNSDAGAWADYDNDGFPDLFVANYNVANILFHNNGDGSFTQVRNGAIVNDVGLSEGAAWGDYDNDGFLDLFVANGNYEPGQYQNFLYHNNGDGTFTKITTGNIATDRGSFASAAWEDFDNDGNLDLFVSYNGGVGAKARNLLYHNNGDGTFTRILTGSPVNDGGVSNGAAWGDYDKDGFPDLFVANNGRPNLLYRNNGNGNNWITLNLVGKLSNRSAIGAKVRVKATIHGKSYWQMRHISNGDGYSGNSFEPHFGLGNATIVDTVRIEWPSGIVQEMQNVAVKQFLPVTEPVLMVQPKAQEFVGGADLTFNVATNSTSSTNYQWRFNGADLAGETNAVLNVQSVAVSSAGKYTVVVMLPNGDTVESTTGVIKPPVPPTITTQPQSQTVDPGGTATFQVSATGSPPLLYQWRLNEAPIDGATDATLMVTNAQPVNAGDYTVEVRNLASTVTSSNATLSLIGAAKISVQPKDQSVSLGANVTFSISVSGTAPFTYQWRLNGADIAGATNRTLTITNVALPNDGRYSIVLRNGLGSDTSREALLSVDATFTKITVGSIVNDVKNSNGAAWADYDNDGYLDLVLANGASASLVQNNSLYHNNGDGSFTKIATGPVVGDVGKSFSVAWGDYDNDGFIDLFVGKFPGPPLVEANSFYRNLGGTSFQRITAGDIVKDLGNFDGVWGDYDNDGFLDIFLANYGRNLLYRNNGNGTFTKITSVPMVAAIGSANGAAWADYDNDGYLDLFVFYQNQNNSLFHNNGDGTFSQLNEGPIVSDKGPSVGGAWGDYDNDGFLDLFVANGNYDASQHNNFLYHNNGNGTFTKITNGVIVTSGGSSGSAAWEDFDNDGNLDLFVSHNTVGSVFQKNYLYHNNGDGTFTAVTAGSLSTDGGFSNGAAWGDYNNDGFPDLFVANYGQKSLLYKNNGNTNSWITFKCEGRISNRSAIGAKVRVKATIRGKTYWQMRHISNGDGLGGNSLYPHFGLGDATNIDTVRIEWPSFIVQELHNVAVKQFLPVIEPEVTITPKIQELVLGSDLTFAASNSLTGPLIYQWRFNGTNIVGQTNATLVVSNAQEANLGKYSVALTNPASGDFVISAPARLVEPPRLAGLVRQADRSVQFSLIGPAGVAFRVETSSNLFNWTPLVTITNRTRTEIVVDTNAANFSQRFYRALTP